LNLMQWRAILAVAGGAGLEEVLGSVGGEESQGGRNMETVDQRVNSLDQIRAWAFLNRGCRIWRPGWLVELCNTFLIWADRL
jgi:hypothetical protein